MQVEDAVPMTGNEVAEPANIVIFGATGDLTKRKLIPALIRMLDCGLLHKDSRIIGIVQSGTKEEWIQFLYDALHEYSHEISEDIEKWNNFSARMDMVTGDLADEITYSHIADAIQTLGGKKNIMFYCAIPPNWYTTVTEGLGKVGLVSE